MFLFSASKIIIFRLHVCESCDKPSQKCGYVERLPLATKSTASKDMASRLPAASGIQKLAVSRTSPLVAHILLLPNQNGCGHGNVLLFFVSQNFQGLLK